MDIHMEVRGHNLYGADDHRDVETAQMAEVPASGDSRPCGVQFSALKSSAGKDR